MKRRVLSKNRYYAETALHFALGICFVVLCFKYQLADLWLILIGSFFLLFLACLRLFWLLIFVPQDLSGMFLSAKRYQQALKWARFSSDIFHFWFKMTGESGRPADPGYVRLFLATDANLADCALAAGELDAAVSVWKEIVEVATTYGFYCLATEYSSRLFDAFEGDKGEARPWAEKALYSWARIKKDCPCGEHCQSSEPERIKIWLKAEN